MDDQASRSASSGGGGEDDSWERQLPAVAAAVVTAASDATFSATAAGQPSSLAVIVEQQQQQPQPHSNSSQQPMIQRAEEKSSGVLATMTLMTALENVEMNQAQHSLSLKRARSSLDDGPIGTSQTTDANVVVGYTESEYMEWQEQHRKHQAVISECQALQERLQLFRRVWDEVHDFLTDSAGIVFDDNGAAFDNNGVPIYNDYHRSDGGGHDGHLRTLRETLTLLEAERARILQDRFACICRILSRCPNVDGLSHIPRAAAIDLSSLPPSSFPIGYAKKLGRALKIARQNAVPVPSLTVHVDRLLSHGVAVNVSTARDWIRPLVRQVQTPGTTLRRVHLVGVVHFEDDDDDEVNNMMVESFLTAIIKNPSIKDVRYECEVPDRSLARFLLNATSLKTLHIDFGDGPPLGQAVVVDGLAAMLGTLESLTLNGIETDWDEPYVHFSVTMLERFNIPSSTVRTLKTLNLSGRSPMQWDVSPVEFWQALATFLQSTTVLESLGLSYYDFTEEKMDHLLNGLGRPFPNTVSKLVIGFACTFTEGAANALVAFMNTVKDTGSTSSLQELHFDMGNENMFDSSDVAGPIIARMLHKVPSASPPARNGSNDQQLSPTIGSLIETVSLTRFSSECAGFLTELLQEHPERVGKLVRLHLQDVNEDVCRDLRQWFKFATIQELHLTCLVNPHQCAPILRNMLRENGSLLAFTADAEPSLFTPTQSRRAEAYLERNRFVRQQYFETSQQPPHSSEESAVVVPPNADSLPNEGVPNGDTDDATTSVMEKLFHPPLYQAVMQIPSDAVHVLVRDMSSLGESIGPD